jgi:hypothetical protein
LVAGHGECGNDTEGGGGGAGVADAVGQVCPRAGAGGLALPLVSIVAEGGGGAAHCYGKGGRVAGHGCFVDRLRGEGRQGFVDAQRSGVAGGGASRVGGQAEKLILIHGRGARDG